MAQEMRTGRDLETPPRTWESAPHRGGNASHEPFLKSKLATGDSKVLTRFLCFDSPSSCREFRLGPTTCPGSRAHGSAEEVHAAQRGAGPAGTRGCGSQGPGEVVQGHRWVTEKKLTEEMAGGEGAGGAAPGGESEAAPGEMEAEEELLPVMS